MTVTVSPYFDQSSSAAEPGANGSSTVVEEGSGLRYSALGLITIIVATAVGNLLVCAAVCVERRLQNITNYFLMSLSIADLLVSLLVMPLAMIVELFGEFIVEQTTLINQQRILSLNSTIDNVSK